MPEKKSHNPENHVEQNRTKFEKSLKSLKQEIIRFDKGKYINNLEHQENQLISMRKQLDDLKQEISYQAPANNEEYEAQICVIESQLKQFTQDKLAALKKDIDGLVSLPISCPSAKLMSQKIIDRAQNPKNIQDHLIGIQVAASNFALSTGKLVGKTIGGIVKIPVDLRDWLTGQKIYSPPHSKT